MVAIYTHGGIDTKETTGGGPHRQRRIRATRGKRRKGIEDIIDTPQIPEKEIEEVRQPPETEKTPQRGDADTRPPERKKIRPERQIQKITRYTQQRGPEEKRYKKGEKKNTTESTAAGSKKIPENNKKTGRKRDPEK
ncbi:MAG: hypothetical protein U5J96_18485 [Ignavibacteriaceae bacterium]|nr:hypothetical protein [Ignavibacteriaceae bacterium]